MRLFAAFLTSLFLALPVSAQQDEIRGVISSQLESFQRDDFVTAFTFAAPNIVGMFRTPENFARMVVNGYPMVHRPDAVEFQGLEVVDGVHTQTVLFRDRTGVYYTAEYKMVQVGDAWKIAGVSILRAPGVGV